MTYADNRAYADGYLPIMRLVIGPHLLVPSTLEVDTQQAADLVVLRGRDMTIGCRVRRYGYAEQFPWDITIRSHLDSGTKTELMKIREGWGDWMLYAHASQYDPGRLDRYFLIDLDVLRSEWSRDGLAVALNRPVRYRGVLRPMSNGDGTHFVAFDVRRYPRALVIASSHDIPYDLAEVCR